MARSPEMAAEKSAVAEAAEAGQQKSPDAPKRLRGPDGFVYAYTEILAKEPGFFVFNGKTDKRGFAIDE